MEFLFDVKWNDACPFLKRVVESYLFERERDHHSTIHLIAFMVVANAKGITTINVSSISKLNSLIFTKRII